MKPTDLVALLQECYRDRLALAEHHRAVAVHVPGYDINNTYQYVINREETHLEWLAAALVRARRAAAHAAATGRL